MGKVQPVSGNLQFISCNNDRTINLQLMDMKGNGFGIKSPKQNRFSLWDDSNTETKDGNKPINECKELVFSLLKRLPYDPAVCRGKALDDHLIKYRNMMQCTRINSEVRRINEFISRVSELKQRRMIRSSASYNDIIWGWTKNERLLASYHTRLIKRLESIVVVKQTVEKYHSSLESKVNQYKLYLAAAKAGGHIILESESTQKHKTYTFNDLKQQKVIEKININGFEAKDTQQVLINFSTAHDGNVFFVTVKYKEIEVCKTEIKMSDLRRCMDDNVHFITVDDIVLQVNLTVHLLEKHFFTNQKETH